MTSFEVRFLGAVMNEGEAPERPPSTEGLRAFLDEVMEGLVHLGVTDPAIGAAGRNGRMELSLSVLAVSPEEAIAIASQLVRKAIQDAGGRVEGAEIDWTDTRASRTELIEA